MTEKELREIKRRFRADKNNILSIKGCLVNVNKEIIAKINQPLATCNEEETKKLLDTMKKSLSGALGTNLLDIAFGNEQVLNGPEHKILMAMKNSGLKDEDAVNAFYESVIKSVSFEGSYAILLAYDRYDVFNFAADGSEAEDSAEIFDYFICSICPIKPLKSGLYFRNDDTSFRNIAAHSILSAPELGFMFPCFDDRTANIYNALYYTKDILNIHNEFIENVFKSSPPMAPAIQKQSFENCLSDSLEKDVDFGVVRTVHDQIYEMVKEHKEQKQEEPLTLSKGTLRSVLEFCGTGEDKLQKFEENFEEKFGKNAEVTPKSIVNVNKFEVSTPDITIKVNPERTDLVSTQIINGVRYIMIRANDGVEVNGVKINISDEE